MRKILCLIVMCFIFLTSCAKKEEVNSLDKIVERDILIAGVKQDAGPFGHINENGQFEGFDIDVAKYIAKKMVGNERKIKFIPVTPATRIEALTSGQVDLVIATMSATKSRRYLIDMSVPYFSAGQTAVVREDSNIYTFADLKDKTTIVVLGSTSEQNLRRVIPTARIVGYTNYKDAFQALLDEKGDAVSTDDSIISGFIAEHKGYRVLQNRISTEHYVVGVKQTEDRVLLTTVNSIINDMHRDGTLKKLKKKWKLL